MEMAVTFLSVLLVVAFFTLFERKFLSSLQDRVGPNKVSVMGVLQPFSDMLKLISKNSMAIYDSFGSLYLKSPMIMLIISSLTLAFLPTLFSPESGVSIMVVLALLSVSGLPLIFSGWFSQGKYSVYGSFRSISQQISFEIPLAAVILILSILMKSFSIKDVSLYTAWVGFLFGSPWLVGLLFLALGAEAARLPFDLPESESELVSGYSVEYGGVMFTFVFLAESLSLVIGSILASSLLLGGISPGSCLVGLTLAALARGVFPRVRYDKAMDSCWVEMVPILIGSIWLCASLAYASTDMIMFANFHKFPNHLMSVLHEVS